LSYLIPPFRVGFKQISGFSFIWRLQKEEFIDKILFPLYGRRAEGIFE